MDYPKGGLLGKIRRLLRRLGQMRITNHAADAGFFILLSLFPMLVLVMSILRYTSLDARDLMDLLEGYLPAALRDMVRNVVIRTYAHTGAGVVSLSAFGALWSASRGIHGILQGLNGVYGVPETRSWLQRRVISVGYTFAFLLVVLLSLAVNVFGGHLLELLPREGAFWQILWEMVPFRFVLMLLLQTVLFCAMYTVLPNKTTDFRDNFPGAVFASLGWIVFSDLFSLYVEHWAGYANLYGSVYVPALGMLWLYFCMIILFCGGGLNRLLMEKEG